MALSKVLNGIILIPGEIIVALPLIQLWLNLTYTTPSPVVVLLAEQMDPGTEEQAANDSAYLLKYLARESSVLGHDHPRLACDALAVAVEMQTWKTPQRPEVAAALSVAMGGQGACVEDAATAFLLYSIVSSNIPD